MNTELTKAAQKNGPEVELCEQMQRAQSRVRLLKPDDFDAPELDLSDSHTALFALAEYWKGKYDKLKTLTAAQPARDEEKTLAKYLTDLADRLDSVIETPTDTLEAKRYLHEFAHVLKFSASLPTQPAAQAEAHPLASRCYTMSESHLSGHRLILGFETMDAAQAAHAWVANLGKPAAQATPEPRSLREAREDAQRARMMARAAGRAPSAATADFDLPAPNDDTQQATPEPEWETSPKDGEQWETSPKEATPEPVGEVVYQYQIANGSWIDQTKESHDYNVKRGQATVRVLYTHPAPGVPDVEDLRDRLVAISAAVADLDDRAAQSMLGEILLMLAAAQAKGGGNG